MISNEVYTIQMGSYRKWKMLSITKTKLATDLKFRKVKVKPENTRTVKFFTKFTLVNLEPVKKLKTSKHNFPRLQKCLCNTVKK